MPGVQLDSDAHADLSSTTTIGHAARTRRADKMAVLQATNATVASINYLAGAPLGTTPLYCDPIRKAHIRALKVLLVKAAFFIKECRKHEVLRVDDNHWTFDYVTDLRSFAEDVDDASADPETQRGSLLSHRAKPTVAASRRCGREGQPP